MRRAALAVCLLASAVLAAAQATAPPPAPVPPASESRQCAICHGKREFKKAYPDGSVRPLFVDETLLHKSAHGKRQCTECHADITTIPHPDHLATVNCQRCHFPGNPVGAPENINYEGYTKSVHGRLRLAGNTKAPLCQDCHGKHLILKHKEPASTVNKENVPATCGRCHVQVFGEYRRSVHGVALLEKRNTEAPSCIDCHGEHSILPPKENASEVSASHIPETCSQCHASMAFSEKYGITVNPVKTFKHTFHGIANELGSKRVANCKSCHTAHDVLPERDPRSTVNDANVPVTCGKSECHPGANANYARGNFHIDPSQRSAGIIYWVALFFKVLTISTLAALLVHILLDFVKKLRHKHAGGHHRE